MLMRFATSSEKPCMRHAFRRARRFSCVTRGMMNAIGGGGALNDVTPHRAVQ
jgi:hypothetical protein